MQAARRLPLLCLALATPGAAEAGIEAEAVGNCTAELSEAGRPPADCVNRAQGACFEFPAEAPAAATACFLGAREQWAALIAKRMEEIGAKADPEIAAVAGIELKYALLANFLQCDRMNDLRLLREGASDLTLLQKTRCEATATGLAYVQLQFQSRGLP